MQYLIELKGERAGKAQSETIEEESTDQDVSEEMASIQATNVKDCYIHVVLCNKSFDLYFSFVGYNNTDAIGVQILSFVVSRGDTWKKHVNICKMSSHIANMHNLLCQGA